MPYYHYESILEKPAFTAREQFPISLAVVINLLGCIAISHAFKYGIAGRV